MTERSDKSKLPLAETTPVAAGEPIADSEKPRGIRGRLSYVLRASGDVLRAAKHDVKNSPNKVRTIASGVGAVALQGFDRVHASVVFVPIVAADVFKDTHSPIETAIAAGATFGAWCLAIGATATEGLCQYPEAVSEFDNNFPALADFFEESLPGFDETERKGSVARRVGGNVLMHTRRGLTVSGIGTTAYVGASVAGGRSSAEAHKLNLKASTDGGAIIGGVAFGVAEAVLRLSKSDPELALRIQNDASNIKVWYAVAGLTMVGQYLSSRVKRFRNRHSEEVN